MAHDPQTSRTQQGPQNAKRRQQQHHHQHQQQQHHHQLQQLQHHNNEPDDEVSVEYVSLPYRKAYEMAETFAATRIGQFFIARGDSILKTIETTAKWSMPKAQLDDKLQRPMSWLPFLMLIITLRLARVWLSIAALMIGNAPISAHDVVYFIQTRRRKLRSLRLSGVKEINERNAKKKTHQPQQGTIKSQLMSLLNRAFCRPGQHYQSQHETEHHVIVYTTNKEMAPSMNDTADFQAAKRLRSNDDCEANLTVDQMLNKFSILPSDDDPDFVPEGEENDTSGTSPATSDVADESEAELNEHPEANKNHEQHNESIELLEDGTVPKPMLEIKKEKHSDTESNATAHENGPTNNGGENRGTDVAEDKKVSNATHNKKSEKAKAGHSKTGNATHNNGKLQEQSTLNATAAAGSPPEFNTFYQQQHQHFQKQNSHEETNKPATQNQSTAQNPKIVITQSHQNPSMTSTDEIKSNQQQRGAGQGHHLQHRGGHGYHNGHGNGHHQQQHQRHRRQHYNHHQQQQQEQQNSNKIPRLNEI